MAYKLTNKQIKEITEQAIKLPLYQPRDANGKWLVTLRKIGTDKKTKRPILEQTAILSDPVKFCLDAVKREGIEGLRPAITKYMDKYYDAYNQLKKEKPEIFKDEPEAERTDISLQSP